MDVTARDFSPDEITIEIECECGNKRMMFEASNHTNEKIFVYRYGCQTQFVRCARPLPRSGALGCTVPLGWEECRERYRITLTREGEDDEIDSAYPFVEIERLDNRLEGEILRAPFPKRKIQKPKPMYPYPPWPDPNPYKR